MLRCLLSRIRNFAFKPLTILSLRRQDRYISSIAHQQYESLPRGALLLGGLGGWFGLAAGSASPTPMVKAISKVLPSTVQVRVEISGKRIEHPDKVFVANGTGFVVSPDGLILTNAHVVGDILEGGHIRLIYYDDQSTWADLVGLDFQSDLALLCPQKGRHIDIAKYPPVRMGVKSDSELLLGSPVAAIGNPLGLHNSVALGVVAGVNRSNEEARQPDSRIKYLQTDLHTNAGSSGGPLITANGTVIGLVTTRAEVEGVTFAIQLDTVQDMITQLRQEKKVFRPWIGIKGISLTPELILQVEDLHRMELLNSLKKGVLITKIHEKSPARDVDLRPGDIITYANNRPVACLGDILRHVNLDHPKIDIQAIRINHDGSSSVLNARVVADEFDFMVGGFVG